DRFYSLLHRPPVLVGHLFRLFLGGVVVLRKGQGRLAIAADQDACDGVVVLGLVLAPAHRAPVRVPQELLWLDSQDGAFVLIWPALPLTSPEDRAALFPVRRHLCPMHVLLDLL